MSVPFVDLKAQYNSIKVEIDGTIRDVIEATRFIGGKWLSDFEEKFARFCDTKYAIGVSSGTNALHLALVAAGVGPGDEVITVPNTFIATTEVISTAGADIKFVEMDPKTYNMDPSFLKANDAAKLTVTLRADFSHMMLEENMTFNTQNAVDWGSN